MIDRPVAASANTAYTATRIRPGPLPSVDSATGHIPDLLAADRHDRHGERTDRDGAHGPARVFSLRARKPVPMGTTTSVTRYAAKVARSSPSPMAPIAINP